MTQEQTKFTPYQLAERLVRDHVIYCISSLMGSMATLSNHVDSKLWRDEFCEYPDELLNAMTRIDYEEAADAWLRDADEGELEEACEHVGYWSDALEAAGLPEDTDGDELSDEQKSRIVDYIKRECDDWREFCSELSVDTDDHVSEVYEHWLISDWLRRKLGEKDEVVGDFAGLTFWGRCCTGQSIALDYTIQQIACETWPDELSDERRPEDCIK